MMTPDVRNNVVCIENSIGCVKNLTTPCLSELDRLKVERESHFCDYSTLHELAKLLIIYLTTMDNHRSYHTVPGRQASAAHEIIKTIESSLL